MNPNIIAINITYKGQLLNKDLVPILLYTRDVNKSINNIFEYALDIGNNLFTYINNNFIKINNKIDLDRYLKIKISCIFFNQEKKSHINVSKNLQDVCLVNSDKEIFSSIITNILKEIYTGNEQDLSNEDILKDLRESHITPEPVISQVTEVLDSFELNSENRNIIINYFKEQLN